MMPFGSTRLLDRAHQLDRDRVLVAQQLAALELADAVLGAEAAAVARDQVVHGAIDLRREAQEFLRRCRRAAGSR